MKRYFLIIGILLFLCIGYAINLKTSNPPSKELSSKEVSITNPDKETINNEGLHFVLVEDSEIMKNRASTGGISWVDFDNDGDDDAFATNGYDVSKDSAIEQTNWLYENDNGKFRVVKNALSNDMGFSSGSAWADFNNDGLLDVFIPNQREQDNFLYLNQGKGSFLELKNALPSKEGGSSFASSWGDIDNDGYVDLFVANGGLTRRQKDFLYKNHKGNSFELLANSPVTENEFQSGGGTFVDYDLDGDLDLYVAGRPVRMYKNLGRGNFEKDTVPLFTYEVPSTASSGISYIGFTGAWADFDNDGDWDLFQSFNRAEPNRMYANQGNGRFDRCDCGDLSKNSSTAFHSLWADLNNDGYQDIIVANWGRSPFIYLNQGGHTFKRINLETFEKRAWYASMVATSDYDLDGDLDLVVGNWPGKPGEGEENLLFRNESTTGNFIALRLQGSKSNSSAIGTRVELHFQNSEGKHKLMREVRSQDGWRSQSSMELFFGLGDAKKIEKAVIYWPSGTVEEINSLEVGERYKLIEN